jgi:cysteine desulfurase/selenocysteine lyase
MMNAKKIRKDFPIFTRKINGKPIIYLDSSATALKPQCVIDAVNTYYNRCTANVFRGIYTLSEEATKGYEKARADVAAFIRAKTKEVVFTRNTSESLNLIAYSWLPDHVKPNDEVITTIMEHHSNFVPWQQMRKTLGYKFTVWNLTPDGTLDLHDLEKMVTKKTKLVTLTAVSNVLGTINPIKKVTGMVKTLNPGCMVVVDAAQAVPHMPVDVEDWGADAIAFSSHKMLGPSGMGALWMKKEILDAMKPFLYGGDMIKEVHEQETVFNDIPHKFEAGTPYIEGAMGFGAAVGYLKKIGMKHVRSHEKELTAYAYERLSSIGGITIYGPKNIECHAGVLAFQMKGIHPHDVAQVLDEDNICVRVGFHCAMPLHEYLGIGATVRASFNIYNDKEDIDALVEGLRKVKKMFK